MNSSVWVTILEGLVAVWPFWLACLGLSVLALLCTRPQAKGKIGEALVNLLAHILLSRKFYRILRGVTFQTDSGTTQIDHIIISRYGIFVLETKNYQGWIFGREKDFYWTQKIYSKSRKFLNPLYQNRKHIDVLAEVAGIEKSKIFSVIVFVGDSEFKTEMPGNVTHIRSYLRYIKGFKQPLFAKHEVTDILGRIEERRLPRNAATRKAHVQNLQASKDHTGQGNTVLGHDRSWSPGRRTVGRIGIALLFILTLTVTVVLPTEGLRFVQGWVRERGIEIFRIFEREGHVEPMNAERISVNNGSGNEKSENSTKEFVFSEEDVNRAIGSLALQRFQERGKTGGSQNQMTQRRQAQDWWYEIEFVSGERLYSRDAKFEGNNLKVLSDTGLEMVIERSEIAQVKKVLR